ncbi:iron-sulfur cluster biosynthesis protein [Alkalibacterium putridalgicola]|uniref:iron-sulfur cluster biosynthesis protein n=1 Tax=Alkalibacterium putridalgicola TaxID=426703 RepID=UPI0034CF984B
MKIEIGQDAISWFEENIYVGSENGIRFFPKLTRGSNTGITVGIEPAVPHQSNVNTTVNDVTYFIEEGDEWLFDYKDVHIRLDREFNEPMYKTE